VSAEIGFIYVLSCPMMEGCYKVGASTNDPIERARQLSAASGVVYPFTVAFQRKVNYPFKVEAALHRMLDEFRINECREFFKVKLHKIIDLAERYEECRAEFNVGDGLDFAKLFATFPDDYSPRVLTDAEREKIQRLRHEMARRL